MSIKLIKNCMLCNNKDPKFQVSGIKGYAICSTSCLDKISEILPENVQDDILKERSDVTFRRYTLGGKINMTMCKSITTKQIVDIGTNIDDIEYHAGSDKSNKTKKPTNEDRVIQSKSKTMFIAGIFDGHGGETVSSILAGEHENEDISQYFLKKFNNVEKMERYSAKSIIKEGFLEWDKHIIPSKSVGSIKRFIPNEDTTGSWKNLPYGGSTGSMVFIDQESFMFSHVGDSEWMFYAPSTSKEKEIFMQSGQHEPTPGSVEEKRVLEKSKTIDANEVSSFGVEGLEDILVKYTYKDYTGEKIIYRVGRSGLAMSRSFGDYIDKVNRASNTPTKYDYDGIISVVPSVSDVMQIPEGRDSYIIIASDGVWDGITKKQAMEIIDNNRKDVLSIESGLRMNGQSERMRKYGGRTDDTSVIVIGFTN